MHAPTRSLLPLLLGAIGGVAAGDLLLGLNPALLRPPAAARLLLLTSAAAALLCVPFVLLPRRRPTLSRGAWYALAAASALFGLYVESQRTLDYAFLGAGARRTLVATTLVALAGAALAAMRPSVTPALSGRFLVGVLVLFLLPPFFGRRAPEPSGLASPPPLLRTSTRSLLVIGLDGVSWDLVAGGASEGSLPSFARLLKQGAGGPLASLVPYDRAALWTSAATGKRPSKHGVVSTWRWQTPAGTLRLLPRVPGGGPVDLIPFAPRRKEDGGSRRSLTFWEILSARGHEVAVLNWPASHPAKDGLVLWATESAFAGDRGPDAARPVETAERVRLFTVEVPRLDRPLVRALVPGGLTSKEDQQVPLEGAARDLMVLGAAFGAVPSGANNVSALVLSGAAGVSRRFGAAADSRYWGISAPDAEARAHALAAYYRFLDDLLGELAEREGKDRTVCVFSPVGYGPPPPLTAVASFVLGQEPQASPEASPDGFLLLAGSGIRNGVRLTSANVLDLAPTLLVLAGEPIARDMDGRVLAEAFDERLSSSASVPIITTYEPSGPQ